MCHYVQKTEKLPTPKTSLKELEKENKKIKEQIKYDIIIVGCESYE